MTVINIRQIIENLRPVYPTLLLQVAKKYIVSKIKIFSFCKNIQGKPRSGLDSSK